MAVTIDHIAIPAYDHEASAQSFAHIMGVAYAGPERHFAPVRVSESFSVAFMRADHFTGYHMGFHIGKDDFDGILSRIQAAAIPYGNSPRDAANGRTDHPFGGRGLFFVDANGHLFEVMTKLRED